MTYHNAVKYITTAPTKTGVAESLDRIGLLCKRLSSPERRLRYIRFAGSNGKTVCQTMLSSILAQSGIRSGSLFMPARPDPRQNIFVGSEPISMENIVKYVTLISGAVNELRTEISSLSENAESDIPQSIISGKTSITPTKNEIVFLIALMAFRDAGCELCLIECDHNGVDPTKVLAPPKTTVICGTIPEENTKEIFRIRSYIINGITEVISAPQDSETYKIISSACAKVNCRLSVPTRSLLDISRMTLGGSEFVYRNESYRLGVCGRFQIHNATTVIEVVRSLKRRGMDIPLEAVKKGLESLSIHSKFEVISVLPTIIVDSTHKTEAVGTMCSTLADFKEQLGNEICLCINPDPLLISEYFSVLSSLGFSVKELIIPLVDKSPSPELEVSCPITVLSSEKATAKKIVSVAKEKGAVLVTAPDMLSEKLRNEILRILDF